MRTEKHAALFTALLVWTSVLGGWSAQAAERPPPAVDLRCEYLADPLGIDVARPRLSWRLDWPERGQRQTAYRVLVASTPELLGRDQGDLWDSGKVGPGGDVGWDQRSAVPPNAAKLPGGTALRSSHPTPVGSGQFVEYGGRALCSEQFCYWKVQAWDKDGRASDWSEPARWSMGLLTPTDWKAKWIGLEGAGRLETTDAGDHRRLPARMLRREFVAGKKIARATAYVCGLGLFELYLNGQRVGDHVLDPLMSNYAKRAFYVTFDVTGQLRQRRNALGVILGNGRFFAPRVKLPMATPSFGYPKLLLQLRIEYEDGSNELVLSDRKWRVTDRGPIRANSEFDGEEYDARLEQDGWDEVGFDDSKWEAAQLVAPPGGAEKGTGPICAQHPPGRSGKLDLSPFPPGGALVAQMIEPMRVTETLRPVAITRPKPGTYLVDFGQNLYGVVRLKVHGPAGTRVQVRTSFSKKPDGTIKMEDNRSALSTDVYVCRGKGEEVWAPRFRGQGTHYAEVTGWPGVPIAEDFQLLVVHTDMEKVGEFTCSNGLLNRIYANVVRGMRMQERGIPLDPDRDERQAWLGHPAKTSESEGYVLNVAPFYASFMGEIRVDQRADGNISDAGSIWPLYLARAIWPSVITVTPDWYYRFYGDRRILEENYATMKRWLLFLEKTRLQADGTIGRDGFGDWVDAYSMNDRGGDNGATPVDMMQTAYFCHNCRILARTAELLGRPEDKAYFGALAAKVAAAFNKKFFHPEANAYRSGTQCSYVLPLAFDLVPADHRAAVAANLIDDVLVKHQGHLTVGLVGMQWFMQTLDKVGRPDVAFTVATQTTRPSWGYMIAKGATSIWERWDQDTRDPGMNGESQMILAGNLAAWFYQTLAGIDYDPAQPGFRHVILRPRPVGDLTAVTAAHKCPYGTIRSAWRIRDGVFHWDVTVPPDTTATVYVPTNDAASVTESGKPAAEAAGIKFLRAESGAAVYEVVSGNYNFAAHVTQPVK